MSLTEHKIPFQFTGRYYTLGNPQAEDIWFILHGQGQLSSYFSRKFESINSPERYLVFPEGLNRYYLEGYNGRVGAGWMTKEDRETDISNYLIYLDQVFRETLQGRVPKRISVLGFSQGAATASRWVSSGKIQCDRLILWAGILPPDMDLRTSPAILSGLDLITVFGESDPYVTKERKNEQLGIMKDLGVESTFLTFKGGHDIDSETLGKLA